MNIHTTPLYVYVLACVVVWALLLGGVWLWAAPHSRGALALCGIFFIGQLSMYIAVHIYRWK